MSTGGASGLIEARMVERDGRLTFLFRVEPWLGSAPGRHCCGRMAMSRAYRRGTTSKADGALPDPFAWCAMPATDHGTIPREPYSD